MGTKTTTIAVGLALAALSTASMAAAPPAAGARWVVKGAGWGHGVGMGAWGTYGFAKNGYSHKRIIKHYFRKTKVKRLEGSRTVRVLLETDSGDVRFRGAKRACGRKLRAQQTYKASRKGSKVVLRTGKGKRLERCGKRLLVRGGGKFSLLGSGRYRGKLLVVPTGLSSLNAVNKVEVNDYARGVVPAEVFPDWPKAALRAFAVAARSIGLTTDVGGDGFELYPDTRTQVYEGMGAETKRTNKAVSKTRNQVARHRGKTVQTVYSASTGGRTESRFLGGPKVSYLHSVKDPYDHYAPLHRWTLRFSQGEMDSRLGPYVRGRLRKIKVLKRGDSPRIVTARLVGSRSSAKVRGDTLQSALGAHSRWMQFKKK